jgi:uncharacterized membrane protein YfcA
MLVVAIALALLVGVSLGLLGGGGSILTLPILRYALGIEAHVAIAASLFIVGVTSIAALFTHARAGRVRWATGAIFGAAGMLGAFLAGKVAPLIPAVVLLVAFALMMFATAWAMLRGRKAPVASAHATPMAPMRRHMLVVAEGLVVGVVTGLVGAGGGFLVVPALVLLGGLPMNVAVGTSLVVIAMKSLAGFAGFASEYAIPWDAVLPMSAAAVVGSIVGGRFATRIAPDTLRRGFGWFVVAMAFLVLGMEIPKALEVSFGFGWAATLSIVGTLSIYGIQRFLAHRRDNHGDAPMPPTSGQPATAGSRV